LGLPASGSPFALGGAPPGARHPPLATSRKGAERLGRAVQAQREAELAPAVKKKRTSAKSPPQGDDHDAKAKPRSEHAKASIAKTPGKKPKRQPVSTVSSASFAPFKRPESPPDPARQRRANTAAKKSRIRKSGLESRVQGHVSARGKRDQARRDSKKK
jgi:hypothetical protein